MSKPKQSESHLAMGIYHYLDCAIKAKKNLRIDISDKFMSERLPHLHYKTVGRIRKRLEKLGILEKVNANQYDNENLYRITDLKKADELSQHYFGIHIDKQEMKVLALPNQYILEPSKIKSGFLIIKYKLKDQPLKPNQPYPKQFYEDGICPSCNKPTLRDFKHDADNDFDRKCFHCKITFSYSNGIVRAVNY